MNLWQERNWTPMLLKEITKPFDSKEYFFELKFDGIRAIIFVNNKELKIQSRNQQDITHLFPELQTIKKMAKTNTIFDGEIISLENNKPSFSKIQKRLHLKNVKTIERLSKEEPVAFIAFDILYEKKNLLSNTLVNRKKLLKKYPDTDYFIKSRMIEFRGINLFQNIKKLGLEGIVAKKKSGKYHINQRTDDFIKIKNLQHGKFYVGGYEKKKNNLISIALGEKIDNHLHYVGKVKVSPKDSVYQQIILQKKTKNYFADFEENINYVKPTITCHVSYLEKTSNNHLRHPILKK